MQGPRRASPSRHCSCTPLGLQGSRVASESIKEEDSAMNWLQARWKTNLAALALLALTASSCSTNPATGKKQIAFIGEEQEIAMGREADQQIVQSLGLYE